MSLTNEELLIAMGKICECTDGCNDGCAFYKADVCVARECNLICNADTIIEICEEYVRNKTT